MSGVLKTTPLYDLHKAAGARMIDFGGWEMPVQYSGIVEEHHAVRQRVGLFDVSHMGEIEIEGPEALQLVNFVTSNDAGRLKPGQAQYSGLLNDRGGFVDDILVHMVAPDHYFVCVNASNQDGDYEYIRANNRFDAKVTNRSPDYAQIAVQGPRAEETLQKLTSADLAEVSYYHFIDGELNGARARIARTGYTGEDGFEIYLAPASAPEIWKALLAAGAEFGIVPCGLGARNTLRLEAAMPLYGHEIDAETTPWEAGLAWIVKLDKEAFIGRDSLIRQRSSFSRKLVGLEMTGRGIARDGYEVALDGTVAGKVTSGGPSPTLGKNIALCYLPIAEAHPDREVAVIIRGQTVNAITVKTPFYKRKQ